MICNHCQHQNPEGYNFCENCGAPLRRVCPNCGQANPAGSRFCVSCGYAFGGLASSGVVFVPGGRFRGCSWSLLGALTGLLLLCGLLFWATLLRPPVIPRTSTLPMVVVRAARRLRVLQANLDPPQAVKAIGDRVYGVDAPDPEDLLLPAPPDGARLALPESCAPEAEFEVEDVRRVQIWNLAETFGSGPLIYDFENVGVSTAGGEYGYYAEWVVFDGVKRSVVDKNRYSCSGWERNNLICSGPDWREYRYVELSIFSENPACPMPITSFLFERPDLYPLDNPQQGGCTPTGAFTLVDDTSPGVSREGIYVYWNFAIHIPYDRPDDIPRTYYLFVEGVGPDASAPTLSRSACYVSPAGYLTCLGLDADRFSSTNYALYQMEENCTEPIASGLMATIVVEANSVPECEFDVPVELLMVGRSDYFLVPEGDAKFFPISYEQGFGEENTFTAVFDVFDPNGRAVAREREGTCWSGVFANTLRVGGFYAISCVGPDVEDDQAVAMRLYYTTNGCYELIASETWEAVAAPAPTIEYQTESRCALFDGLDMSVVYLDWMPGAPLTFYVRMPGGVPGLENEIPGDSDSWEYSATIGDYSTQNCRFEGYEERLYCSLSLPSGYSDAVRPLTLRVNGCDSAIYSDQAAYLPGIEKGGGEGGGDDTCGPSPVWDDATCASWCACMGGSLDFGCGGDPGTECVIVGSPPCSSYCVLP